MKRTTALLLTLLGVVSAIWWASPYQLGVVVGSSMTPTFRSGQWILIDRGAFRDHRPEPGEIVAFHYGRDLYVKRVLAVERDTIWMLADKAGGAEDLIMPLTNREREHLRPALHRATWMKFVPLQVPIGSFYAIGDNLGGSIDSRELGAIPYTAVLGRVRPLHG
jgi:signal peptidase I